MDHQIGSSCTSGGGGGAGDVGGNGRAPSGGDIPSSDIHFGRGGIGVQVAIAGPATASPVGTPGPSGTGWFAGGGGAGMYSNPTANLGNGSAPLALVERRVIRGYGSGNGISDNYSYTGYNLVVSGALVEVEVDLELPTQVVLEMEVVDNLVL